MDGKIVLISDDEDFFEYIIPKLALRKSDKLLKFGFYDLLENIDLLRYSVFIVNSENNNQKTLELFKIVNDSPVIVFGYNDDEDFKTEAYKNGMFAYFSLSSTSNEINSIILPALKLISTLYKSDMYRSMLVKNNIIMKNNEVFTDYNAVLRAQLEVVSNTSTSAVLMAISPNEKEKFFIRSNQVETIILNKIRKNDVLMNFAPNKYFLLLNNTKIKEAKNLWNKINKCLPIEMYVGFVQIKTKNPQTAINNALAKLQKSINKQDNLSNIYNDYTTTNFKLLKKDYVKKFEQIIYPAFYKIQQIYADKLFGVKFEQLINDNLWALNLISEKAQAFFQISCPGHFAVNVDICYSLHEKKDKKRISLNQDEFEEGILTDLLDRYVLEFKDIIDGGINNDYT